MMSPPVNSLGNMENPPSDSDAVTNDISIKETVSCTAKESLSGSELLTSANDGPMNEAGSSTASTEEQPVELTPSESTNGITAESLSHTESVTSAKDCMSQSENVNGSEDCSVQLDGQKDIKVEPVSHSEAVTNNEYCLSQSENVNGSKDCSAQLDSLNDIKIEPMSHSEAVTNSEDCTGQSETLTGSKDFSSQSVTGVAENANMVESVVSTAVPNLDEPQITSTASSFDNTKNFTTETAEDIKPQKVKPSRRKKTKKRKVAKAKTGQKRLNKDASPATDGKMKDAEGGSHLNTSGGLGSQGSSGKKQNTSVKSRTAVLDDSIGTRGTSADDVSSRKRQKMQSGRVNMLVHCTACNCQIGVSARSEAFQHPLLNVLICKKCYEWCTSAEIEKGADGKDEQCRWCSEGGELICCDFCHNAFCKSCIRRNLGRKALMDILNAAADESKWSCYICDCKPILSLTEKCASVIESLVMTEVKPKITPPQMETNRGRKRGRRPKSASNQRRPMIERLSIETSKTSPIYSSAVVRSNRRNARSVGPPAVDPNFSLANVIVNEPHTISLASFQKTSPIPSFYGGGQLTGHVDPVANMQSGIVSVGQGRQGLQLMNSMDMMGIVDHLLSASGSLLNFLVLLNDELSSASRKFSSLESMPLLADQRRKIAKRFWSSHSNYLQMFQSLMQNERLKLQYLVAQKQLNCTNTFPEMLSRQIKDLDGSGNGRVFVGYEQRSVSDQRLCDNRSSTKQTLHSSVALTPTLGAVHGIRPVPIGCRLTNVGAVNSQNQLLVNARKRPLASAPHGSNEQKRKCVITLS